MLFGRSASFVGRGRKVMWEERTMKGQLRYRCEGILVRDIPAGKQAGALPKPLRGRWYAQVAVEDRIVVKSKDVNGKRIVFTCLSRSRVKVAEIVAFDTCNPITYK